MFKSIFFDGVRYFNVSFSDQKLFKGHRNLNNFTDIQILIGKLFPDAEFLDVELYATEQDEKFVDYSTPDVEIVATLIKVN